MYSSAVPQGLQETTSLTVSKLFMEIIAEKDMQHLPTFVIFMQHGLVHVSAGDLLRAEVEAGTEAGMRAKKYMDEGNLVPNEVVVDMVVRRLQQEDAQTKGWLLDGYPRSAEQAEAIQAAGIHPDAFILIHVSKPTGSPKKWEGNESRNVNLLPGHQSCTGVSAALTLGKASVLFDFAAFVKSPACNLFS